MNIDSLLFSLKAKGVEFSKRDDKLSVKGLNALDNKDEILRCIENNKQKIIDFIDLKSSIFSTIAIPLQTRKITPAMLPLVNVNQEQIDQIVALVPGRTANVQDIYPLAPIQEGVLYHYVSTDQGDPYLRSSLMAFDKREQLDQFLSALQLVLDRHDILRTSIVWKGFNDPLQVVCRNAQLPIEELTFNPSDGAIVDQLKACFDPQHYRMDLRIAPLIEAKIAYDKLQDRWFFSLLSHHLIGDATAMQVMLAEIGAFLQGDGAALPSPVPYRDYVIRACFGRDEQAEETFFTEMLGDVDEPTLPYGLTDVQGDGRDINEAAIPLESDLGERLRIQARRLGVSAASVFHLAYARVLAALSGRDDVVFGTVLLGRQGGVAEHTLGMFINTLPLRLILSEQTVGDAIVETQHRLAGVLGHEHASLAQAQRCSGIEAPLPLFSALLNYRHNSVGDQTQVSAFSGITGLGGKERTNYPLTVSIDDTGSLGFALTVQAINPVDPSRVAAYIHQAIDGIVHALETKPEQSLMALQVLPDAEQQLLTKDWNATEADYTSDQCIHELVEAHVNQSPHSTAVAHGKHSISYEQLNCQANQLAHYLISLGVSPDDRVAICANRSIEMIVGLLGILKAGGAYVPLDPAYPQERLAFMLEDSAPVALLSHTDLSDSDPLPERLLNTLPVIPLDASAEWRHGPTDTPKPKNLSSHNLAYVIYTSGSTGQPKGVTIEHNQATRLFSSTAAWFKFNHNDVWAFFHSFAFDFSVWEIWGALTHGGRLEIIPPLISRSPSEFYTLVCQTGITVLNQTPSAFSQFIDAQRNSTEQHKLRQIIFGGEALNVQTLKPWLQHEQNQATQLVNMYGITETTVHVTYHPVQRQDLDQDRCLVGKRLPDLQLYLLDEQARPVPLGVVGEIYVGGAGVARGYLNQPKLTAERFVVDPYSDQPQARMYKSGDLARYLPDGKLEYLGRNDFQIKIRGFRIELGEVETTLLAHEHVRDVAVLAYDNDVGDKLLVAYYTGSANTESLRDYLQHSLPAHMVPAAYVSLEALPLTANGKLDRTALPAPQGSAFVRAEYEPPQGHIEETIAQIWCDLLALDRVSRHDNFFALGGHSLLAVRLAERLRQAELALDIKTLFAQPTLKALADNTNSLNEITIPPNGIFEGCEQIIPSMLPLVNLHQEQIDAIVAQIYGDTPNIQDIYPLAPLQEGVLYHYLSAEQGDPYLLWSQMAFDTRERLDQFLNALQSVINRHDILRTGIIWEGLSDPVQVVCHKATLPIEEIILDPSNGAIAEQLKTRFDPRQYQIDVRSAPLMVAKISQDTNNERWILMLLYHHLVVDHEGMEIITSEISTHIQNKSNTLSAPVPYRDYVARTYLADDKQVQQAFFTDMLGDVDEPTLPFDLTNVQGDGRDIDEASISFDTELGERLRLQAQRLGVSAASVFHLAFGRVVAALSGRDDVVFGTVLLGRQGGVAEQTLGMFLNTLPLRLELTEQGVSEAVIETQRRLAGVLSHEHAALSLAQRCSGVAAPLPLFNALLNYRHNTVVDNTQASSSTSVFEGMSELAGEERTNYPLGLAVDDCGSLGFTLTAQVLQPYEAARIAAYMHQTLTGLIQALENDPEHAIMAINVLPKAEQHLLVNEWNATDTDYPSEHCIHELVQTQAAKKPEATAVVQGHSSLSYAELNRQANQLAHHLIELGVKPDDRVAICVERSIEFVIGLLGVLKAGGGYVPLDPSYPLDRLSYICEDSQPSVLLTQSSVSPSVRSHLSTVLDQQSTEHPVPVIDLLSNERWAEYSTADISTHQVGLTPHHLAYVIYTSGSTGQPNGVMIEHHNVCHLSTVQSRSCNPRSDSRVTQFASISFDSSVFEWVLALSHGATLYIPESGTLLAGDALVDFVNRHSITHLILPPVVLAGLAEEIELPTLETVLVAGEAPSQSVVERWSTRQCLFINGYGPTEGTVATSLFVCNEHNYQQLSIGRPISNTRIYLLDENRQPVPLGVKGEIYIAGAGIARGYLNRDALTAQRFLPNSFVNGDSAALHTHARMYKTGDLGRYLPDGNIEYLGRNDFQIKIRGFRVELGEIEARLSTHEHVQEVAVLARQSEHDSKTLVAYYTGEANAKTLRSFLQANLPDFMVPAAYVSLEALPLTSNGKLDREALPDPSNDAFAHATFEAPVGSIEQTIAGIWCDLLALDQVSRHDNFFTLGGHSLLAVRLAERLRQAELEADIKTLFAQPTLKALAASTASLVEVNIPPNGIVEGCEQITPAMLPLVELNQQQIDTIVAQVPGGVSNVQDLYPLAPMQEGMLFHYLSSTDGDPYLLWSQLAFDSREHLDKFTDALSSVLSRHDILRSSVAWEGLNDPLQIVWRTAALPIEELSFNPADGAISDQLRQRFDPRHYRLDLRQAPLIQAKISYDEPEDRWVFLLLSHHFIGDATTMQVLLEEVHIYLLSQQHTLPEPIPYRDYVARIYLADDKQVQQTFFTDMLSDVDEPTLPYGLTDVQSEGHGIAEASIPVKPELGERLRLQAQRLGVSAASVFHLAFGRVVAALSGRDDVVFGTVLLGRQGGVAEQTLGMFLNTLPLRLELTEQGVSEAVIETQRRLAGVLSHEHAALSLAQRCSGVAAPLPLFNALLNYRHNTAADQVQTSAFAGMTALGSEERTNYPLSLDVDDAGSFGFYLTVQALLPVDASRLVAYMHQAISSLVHALENTPERAVMSLDILPKTERHLLVKEWNATDTLYPSERCIHDLVQAQATNNPDSTAVVQGHSSLNYAELNSQANQLAHHLIELGVKPDDRIAICVERSIEMIVGLLGILKSGAAYVPLDPIYPVERLDYMLEDSTPVALISYGSSLPELNQSTLPIIQLDSAAQWRQNPTHAPVPEDLTSSNLAYVIYTSGSTGIPKGVMIEHKGLTNLAYALQTHYELGPDDRMLQFASLSFDMSVEEYIGALCWGACLELRTDSWLSDARTFWQHCHDSGVTLVNLPTAFWHQLVDDETTPLPPSLRQIMIGGEAVNTGKVAQWIARHGNHPRLINAYGPTETSVNAAIHSINDASGAGLIGRPIANTQIYLLDHQGYPVPLGIAGEIHVGGVSVARGYLNQPELTAARFVTDPFSNKSTAKMYKTGDLGRYLPDGNIEYLGRNDFQIKIRGFRVELGEIEARLSTHEHVQEVAVLARQSEHDSKTLVAYYTGEANAKTLRSFLQANLPDFMVPAAYVSLEALPLTSNGKLDREALPDPNSDAFAHAIFEAPVGSIEQTIAGIWCDLLALDQVSRHDNFFTLGGHSLLAVRLAERLRQAELEADIKTLFAQPTLKALAASTVSLVEVNIPPNGIIEGCEQITPAMLPLVELNQQQIDTIVAQVPGGVSNVQDLYPLAPMQEGMLFHYLSSTDGDPYLLWSQLAFDSREHLDKFTDALSSVLSRHDILRSSVAWEGLNDPLQIVWRTAALPIEELSFNPADGAISDQLRQRFDPRHYRLDLRQAPLIQAKISYDEPEDRWVFLLLSHHFIGDATTMQVLLEEVHIYLLSQQHTLPEPIPYRDYVARIYLADDKQVQQTFFTDMLSDVDEPTLPYGLTDVQSEGHGIAEASIPVKPELGERLRLQAQRLGVSAASVFHLAFGRVVAALSGRDDVVFGTVLLGRQGGVAEQTLGMFLNTLPLRLELTEQGVSEAVIETQRRLAGVLSHEHAALSLAQRCSGVAAPLPLFNALLNYRHNTVVDNTQASSSTSVFEGMSELAGEERTNYPLGLAVDDCGSLGFTLTAQVLQPYEAARIAAYMHQTLTGLIQALENDPEHAIMAINVLPKAEQHLLVNEWNATDTDYPSEHCIHELVQTQAAKKPEATAVVQGHSSLSYAELNRQANQLAHHLIELGVKPDDRVAICVERSIEFVIGLLGVLKAGGGYVPLDPSYPLDRLSYICEDSQPSVLLTQSSVSPSVRSHLSTVLDQQSTEHPVPVIDLLSNERWAEYSTADISTHQVGLTPHHLAYVIYTSGSTGQPNGVMIEHHNVCHLSTVQSRSCNPRSDSRVTQFASISFDSSVFEWVLALSHGATLYIPESGTLLAGDALVDFVNRHSITHLILPPVVLAGLAEEIELPTLETVLVAGEAPSQSVVERWSTRQCLFINGYGPTEGTVATSLFVCNEHNYQQLSIGRPISNTRIYLLDENRQPVPLGVKGEIYIAGAGIARGYLNRDALTAQRFLPNSFVNGDSAALHTHARMYKTGDLGRYLPDGNIEYLGRNDFQIKIRGFRVELGEIEARLSTHEHVQEVAVLARQSEHDSKTLVAYYTGEANAKTLRSFLQANLPDFMVPAAYVSLEALPLTSNGKLDREALPDPSNDAFAHATFEAPVGSIEQTIAGIWCDLLALDQVSRHDNFFTLGGHSLLAVRLAERLRQAELEADIKTLFAQPTLKALAASTASLVEVNIPPNGIVEGCEQITPAMLPLVELNQQQIDTIVAQVPGGVSNVQDLYPLAPMQEGMLFHYLSSTDGDPYLLWSQFGFDSREHLDKFTDALSSVLNRYDVLRSSVAWEGLNDPVQIVWRTAALPIEELSFNPVDGAISDQLRQRFDPRHYRLDLRQAPLIHAKIAYDEAEDRWVLMLLLQHIATDHKGLEIIGHDVAMLLQNKECLLPIATPYRDYVARIHLGRDKQAEEVFFTDMLGDVDEPTLPFDLTNVQGDGRDIDEASISFDTELGERLRLQAQRLGVSAASVFHLAFGRVVAALSGRDDVVFGTVLLGRQGGVAEQTLGMFLNTLPLRLELTEQGVSEAVIETQRRLAGVLSHEHAALSLAQRCSGVAAPLPLFNALLNYRHNTVVDNTQASSSTSVFEGMSELAGEERTNYPLGLAVDDCGSLGFTLTAQVLQPYEAARIAAYMHQTLTGLIQALENDPEHAIMAINVLPIAEQHLLVNEWNATDTDYPSEHCIHELVQTQAAKKPEATAVVQGHSSLSYAELNRQANQLAHHLIELGVKPDDRVAICVERSIEFVIGLLGVLKAGGGYVPLDPSYPLDRLSYICEDSQPSVLLTQSSVSPSVRSHLSTVLDQQSTEHPVPVIDLLSNERWAEYSTADISTHQVGLTPHHLAYVIYTSGSTGQPNGVMIEHHNVCHLSTVQSRSCNPRSDSRVTQFASISFDSSVFEWVLALSHGATLYIPESGTLLAGDALVDFVNRHSITHLILPPVVLAGLAEEIELPTLETVLVAGEAPSQSVVERWSTRQCLFINGYGPTEGTVATSLFVCNEHNYQQLSIGRPISNTRIYLLDENRQPVPLGVKGEIYIAGAGIARGYLNRDALTAQRFLPNSFVNGDSAALHTHARMYKTGDLGRYLPDGNIEYLGRNDFQIKIRGFRVELGEIEARLSTHEHVQEVAVLARQSEHDSKTLVAYYTGEANAKTLRSFLQANLPDFMVPAAYVSLEALPLTSNGKLDREALPDPSNDAFAHATFEAPVGSIEQTIAGIWCDLLALDQVSRHDNFFTLGGHSLLTLKVVRILEKNGIQATVKHLVEHPILADFAKQLNSKMELDFPINKPLPIRESGAEKPLFLVHDGTGLGIYFTYLAEQIDSEIPVYGLPAISGNETQLSTIEELAVRMINMIYLIDPHGPYRVAGWSLGGVLAYEIANQLMARDQQVDFLGLIDAISPDASRILNDDSPTSYHEMLLELCEIETPGDYSTQISEISSEQDIFFTVLQKLKNKQLLNSMLDDLSDTEIWQFFVRLKMHGNAYINYRPFPIPMDVHFFNAQEQRNDSSTGWESVLPRRIN